MTAAQLASTLGAALAALWRGILIISAVFATCGAAVLFGAGAWFVWQVVQPS